MQPTSPILQPAMHYVVQPQVQNRPAFVLAELRAPNMQGVVLLNNGFGSMEQIVYPGAQAMSLGKKNVGKRLNSGASMSVFDIGQHVAAESVPGSQKSGTNLGKQVKRMSESRLNSAAEGRQFSESSLKQGESRSVFDIGRYVEAEQVPERQKLLRMTSDGWLGSDVDLSQGTMNSGAVKGRRKTRNRIMSMEELSEQVDDEETAQAIVTDRRGGQYQRSVQLNTGNRLSVSRV
ncbi:hypothetical protein WMY93_024979 [Mugilogobius chulae]|uniref:Uncharacterized protein n=1 Tax=Mugilogobius chulae TaxID=88201 RepID=A0AAW0N5I4_9GOBI